MTLDSVMGVHWQRSCRRGVWNLVNKLQVSMAAATISYINNNVIRCEVRKFHINSTYTHTHYVSLFLMTRSGFNWPRKRDEPPFFVFKNWYLKIQDNKMLLLPNFMDHIPTWEGDSFFLDQKIPRFLWNPKVNCCVHNSLSRNAVQRPLNPLHILVRHLY